MTKINFPPKIAFLFDPRTIREQSQKILEKTIRGEGHFNLNLDHLEKACELTIEVTRENYPELNIPYHCRNNHFVGQGEDKLKEVEAKLSNLDVKQKIASLIDLNIFSVLIDAGAGDHWKYIDPTSDKTFIRSEGLAMASINAFLNEKYFNNLSITASELKSLNESHLNEIFQVGASNPLVGVSGRLNLLNKLGEIISSEQNQDLFSQQRISDPFVNLIQNNQVDLLDVFQTLIQVFNDIWPSRYTLENFNLGDCWFYPFLDDNKENPQNYIPFHKLFQWLSYSLAAVYEQNGVTVENIHQLTGLPEYRNGGLFVDMGVLSFKDENNQNKKHNPSSAEIIEWRALTICLLDKMLPLVQQKMNLSAEQFLLPNMLEGGSWAAGRKVAKAKRSDMSSPIKIESDGTVF